jgi:hypothetical protein
MKSPSKIFCEYLDPLTENSYLILKQSAEYWSQEKERFHSFMKRIQQASPQLRVPIVLLYWPLQPGLEEELKEKIPSMLNVFTTSVLSDHRVMVMSPKNVCEELPQVIEWVGQHGKKPNQLTKTLKVEGRMVF